MTLKKHIDDIRDKLAKREFSNEAAVSQGIVLRLLKALDWPIFEIQIVVPEYTVESGKVDFALCHSLSEPLVFIEVKKVGKIEGAEQQLFEYALDCKVMPITVLTDGEKWRFFHRMGQEDYRERKPPELDFIAGNSEEIADCLNRYLNYESIRTGKAVEAIKEDWDFLKSVERRTESKPILPTLSIPPELRHVIVPPNVVDNETFAEIAWNVARMQWYKKGRGRGLWENVEEMIPSQFSLESILTSDVYEHCVKYLLMKRNCTPEKFHEWVDSFSNMPRTFGRRMGLSPKQVEQMVDEVTNEHNSTTREDNKDAKSENT